MEIAVFYTEGSNRIAVDLYGNEDVEVKLVANKVVQNSIKVAKKFFYNNKAHVTFNFLTYKYDKYTVIAVTENETISKPPNIINAPTSNYETNYLTDSLTSKTTDTIKEMVAKPTYENKGDYLVVNLEDKRLVTIGNALVSYSGGGNRYLNTSDSLLVLQREPCIDINDGNCPSNLGAIFKAENSCTNLIHKITTNTVGKAQVQKGIYADVFTSFEGKLNVDFVCAPFDGSTYCFSALMSVLENTTCSLYYVDENEQEHAVSMNQDEDFDSEPTKEQLGKEYDMINFVFSLDGNYRLRLKLDIFGKNYNKLFLLLPQLELGSYPTSRVLFNEIREKDLISIMPYSTTNMDSGGFLELEAVFSRKTTKVEGCAILEWVNEQNSGVRILQDEDNSLIACINDGELMDSITTPPMEIEEGEHVKIKLEYTKDLIHLTINENEYSTERINYKGFPNPRNEIRLGYSVNEIPSFDGDFLNIRFGK